MKDLSKKVEELRGYGYSDAEIAESFEKNMYEYGEKGYDRQALADFVKTSRKEVGSLEAAWRGLERQGGRLGAGVQQIYQGGKELTGRMTGDRQQVVNAMDAQGRLATSELGKEKTLDTVREQHPWSTLAGEAVPAMLSGGRLGGMATMGGLGLLQYGSPEERARQGALNAGAQGIGGVLSSGASHLIKPIQSMPTNAQTRALGALSQQSQSHAPFKPRLSEVTGSETVRGLEDTLAQTPFVQDVMKGVTGKQQEALNAIAANSIGQRATTLSSDVLLAAERSVDSAYRALRAVKDPVFRLDSGDLRQTAEAILAKEAKKVEPNQQLVKYATLARDAGRSKMTGEQVDVARQEIADLARKAEGGDKHRWGELVQAFDSTVRDSAKAAGYKDVVTNLDEARRVYRNLLTIDTPGTIKGENVMPGQLRTRVGKEGNADPGLNAIADYAGAFPPLQTNSRTFGRAMIPWAMSNPATSLVAAPTASLVTKAIESDPMRAYLIRGLLMNPQLSQRAALLSSPVVRGMLSESVGKGALSPITGGR